MANPRDAFALLLMALDEKQSADAINKQLKNDIPEMLEKLKVELDLPEDSFQAIETFFDKGALKAKEMRGELEKAIRLSTELYENRPAREKTLNMAQTNFGMVDPKITKQTVDAMTNQIKTLTIESTTAEGQIKRMMFALEDGALTNISSVTIVTKINEELKATDKELNKAQAEFLKLIKLEETRGSDANRLSRIKELENKQLELQKQRVEQINQAARDGLISEEQKSALLREHDVLIEQQIQEYSRLKDELDASQQFANSKVALTELKKDYTEYLQLQQREGQEDFTEADREKLEFLRGRITNSKELVQLYPQLKQEFEKFAAAEEKFQNQKAATAESKVVEKEVNAIIKLYDDLQKKQIALYKEEQKAQPGAQADTYREDIKLLEQQIALKQKSLQTTMQTADGERQAVQGLNQIEEHAHKREVERSRIEEDLLNEKRAHIEKVAGTLRQNQDVDTSFIELGDTLDKTSPQLQQFAKDLYGNQAALRNVSIETDKYGNSYYKMSITQDKGADTLQHTTVTVDRLTGSMRELDTITAKNVSRSMTFATQIGHAAKKMSVWGVAAKVLYGSLREVRQGFEFIKDLDKDITQAAIVTGQQRSQVQGLANDYAALAVEMGKTVKEISEVNTELLRQGLTINEASKRLETIIKLSATGRITTEESLRIVTTAVNAMQESHEHAANVLLRASNISASSVEQLGEAFTKTASSAYATGMTIEQTTGILATMLEVTQEGPSQLGTSLKTILARFSRVNEETGEWNTSLNDVQKAIESVGINFTTTDGQIRNVYDILEDLSGIWDTLTKNQQAYIATTSAGVRMQNRFFAVMNNFERVKTITDATAQSANAMNRAYTTYLDSVEASSNRAKAAMEQLWIETINSEQIKMFYDMISNIVQLIREIGALNVALIVLGGYIVKKTGLISLLTLAITAFKTSAAGTVPAVVSFKDALIQSSVAASTQIAKLGVASGGLTKFAVGAKAAAGSLAGLLGPQALATAGVIALGAGITWVIKKRQEHKAAIEAERKAMIESHNDFLNNAANYDLNIMQLEELEKQYKSYTDRLKASGASATTLFDSAEYDDFIRVQDEIIQLLPNVETYMDLYGNTLIKMGENVTSLTELYAKLHEEQRRVYTTDLPSLMTERLAGGYKEIEEAQKQVAKANENLTRFWADDNNFLQGTEFKSVEFLTDNAKAVYQLLFKTVEENELLLNEKMQTWRNQLKQEVNNWIPTVWDGLTDIEKLLVQSPMFLEIGMKFDGDHTDFIDYLEREFNKIQQVTDPITSRFDKITKALGEANAEFTKGNIGRAKYSEWVKELEKNFYSLTDGMTDNQKSNVDLINIQATLAQAFSASKLTIESQTMSFADVVAEMERVEATANMLVGAYNEYNETGNLSIATIKKLTESYGAEAVSTALAEGNVRGLIKAKLDAERIDLTTSKMMISLTHSRLTAIHSEATALENLRLNREGAMIHTADYEFGRTPISADGQAQIAIIDAQLKTLEGLMQNLGQTTSGSAAAARDTLATIDRYLKYTVALEDNTSALEYNQRQQQLSNISDARRVNLIKEEIELNQVRQQILHELNTARRKERDELQRTLASNGFKFIGEADKARITNLENLKGKQQAVQESLERYIELQTSLIPGASNEWWDLEIAIEASKKAVVDLKDALIKAELDKEMDRLQEAYDQQEKQLTALNDVQEMLVKFIKERGKLEKEALLEAQKNELETLKNTYDARKKTYQNDLDEFKAAVQGRIDALNKEKDAENYAKDLNKQRADANELQRRIDLLSLDSSLTARNEVIKLREELAIINEGIAEKQSDRQRQIEIEAMQQQMKDADEHTKNKIELLDIEYKEADAAMKRMHKIFVDMLDKNYTDAKIYEEAHKALLEGKVRSFETGMVDIETVIRNMYEESGHIFGILGNRIEEELTTKVNDAVTALQLLKQNLPLLTAPTDQTRVDLETNILRPYYNRPAEFQNFTEPEYTRYLYNKKVWAESTDKNSAEVRQAVAENAHYREIKGISLDKYSYEQLLNMPAYADGGKNIGPGVAMMHGTRQDPEWIFNDKQLAATLEEAAKRAISVWLPEMPEIISNQHIELNIDNLVRIEGNADKTIIPELKKAGDDLAKRLRNELKKKGAERVAF